ncbi:MAG TPA: hypothetical protein VK875_05975 [Euzebyales bacterium]|nr:hypothetical protein [Euzebyales bacterium]
MEATTTTSPRDLADTTSRADDRRSSTAAGTPSVRRLNVMRIGYLVMGVGLAMTKWPLLINRTAPWPLFEGVATYMLVAMGLLALLGLRYPVKMLPILLFESAWKLLWLAAVALPLWTADRMDPATWEVASASLWVVIVLAVIPWRYVVAQYVTKQGDPWRADGGRGPRPHAAPSEEAGR